MHPTLRYRNVQYIPDIRIGRLEPSWLACTASSAAPGRASGADVGRCHCLEELRTGAYKGKGKITQPEGCSKRRYGGL